ncbi:RagB/SusD family nutrient uptake outer membrane protein [Chitinophaga silvatica]|uniref:RagB/SusD family nutrient uptake outer membrane protein n=1 Tax=Chitinophaga silvatica TaxID=2282649 RepID=A0A3E1YDW1_9BACT|nr:RagB/SusD family nutrient uptake outer membrane protein [Chitinophaga silvatica]RFS24457.1 RagB/SusD family nutrient uptake outer membrane protein [Chitinophaga silvatica]
MYSIKNKNNVYTLLLAIIIAVTGCKKLVEIDPPIDTVGPEIVFKTNDNAANAIAGLYSYMIYNEDQPCLTNGMMTIGGGLIGDELIPTMGAQDLDAYELYTNKIRLSNVWINGMFWGPTYKVIYTANSILEGEAASTSVLLSDSARNQLRSEARLVRGFSYFYLYNLYGDVPMVTSTDVLAHSAMPRTAIDLVKKQVEEDLLFAYQHLPANYDVSRGEKIRPSSYTAAALLARFYLYEKRWADALAMADVVINSGKFTLAATNKVFKANSSEAIWQLKLSANGDKYLQESFYLSPQTDGSMLSEADLEMLFQIDPIILIGLIPNYYLTPSLAGSFENNDLRKKDWIRSLKMPNIEPYNGITYSWPVKHPRLDPETYDVFKPYYTVVRFAELYLISAEAKAQSGDLSGAITDLNTIRSRAGLNGTTATGKEDLLTAILKERRVEFFAEWGHRWFDLKRTEKSATVLGSLTQKQPWSDHSLLLFIPTADIKADPNLKQNPGYSY